MTCACGWILKAPFQQGLPRARAKYAHFFLRSPHSFVMEPSLSWCVSCSDLTCWMLLLWVDAGPLLQFLQSTICSLASFVFYVGLIEELCATLSCFQRGIALLVSSFLVASIWSRWLSKPGMVLSDTLASSSFLPSASTFSNQGLHRGHLHQFSSWIWGYHLADPINLKPWVCCGSSLPSV